MRNQQDWIDHDGSKVPALIVGKNCDFEIMTRDGDTYRMHRDQLDTLVWTFADTRADIIKYRLVDHEPEPLASIVGIGANDPSVAITVEPSPHQPDIAYLVSQDHLQPHPLQDGLYYLQDARATTGNIVYWWAADFHGYTTDLSKARLFTREKATALHQQRPTDIPWPRDYVEKNARRAVDMFDLDHSAEDVILNGIPLEVQPVRQSDTFNQMPDRHYYAEHTEMLTGFVRDLYDLILGGDFDTANQGKPYEHALSGLMESIRKSIADSVGDAATINGLDTELSVYRSREEYRDKLLTEASLLVFGDDGKQKERSLSDIVSELRRRRRLEVGLTTSDPAQLLAYPPTQGHSDDGAIDAFAKAMKAKMALAREKGRGGWDDKSQCSAIDLVDQLIKHSVKGNEGTWVDLANYCMMLHQRGEDPKLLATGVTCSIINAVHDNMNDLVQSLPDKVRRNEVVEKLINTMTFMMGDQDGLLKEKVEQYNTLSEVLSAHKVLVEGWNELVRSRTKYPLNRQMFDALLGEVQELRDGYQSGNWREEALQVAAVALRIADEGDAGGNKLFLSVSDSLDEKNEQDTDQVVAETAMNIKVRELSERCDELLVSLKRLREDAYNACADSSCNAAFELADKVIAKNEFYVDSHARQDGAAPLLVDRNSARFRSAVEWAISHLADAYYSTRAWSAWSYGTMTQNDFESVVDETEQLENLVADVISAYCGDSEPTPLTAPAKHPQHEPRMRRSTDSQGQTWLNSPSLIDGVQAEARDEQA